MPFKRYFTEYNSEYDKNANSKDSTRTIHSTAERFARFTRAGDRHVNQANAR
ncbi:hypothetical protein T10_4974 [Trichinella papuae]|uniref:Uncharacterized protein n=1 Tax=Trichinella papuae TaxID=268474 RepID=A0A0V1LYA1_9BILA|nr:hypothetical protein T10_4974 [Trichinella papuae]